MFVAVLIAAAWFLTGISAWYMLKGRHLDIARRGLSIGLGAAAILLPIQMYIGDGIVGTYVAKYQLPKLEALEGNWTSTNTGYNVLEIPDQGAAKNLWQVTIPWLGSAIAKDWTGRTRTPGLDLTPAALRPMVLTTFYGFRVMYYGALLMFAAALIGVVLRLRGRLYSTRWFHKLLLAMLPVGIFAIWGGWVLAETGRQPWLVYGKLLTADAVSPLKTWQVLATFALFVCVYLSLLAVYAWYVARVVRDGPEDEAPGPLAATPFAPAARPEAQLVGAR
jgi:cytochrome d ubiquinol oxidase subunit I